MTAKINVKNQSVQKLEWKRAEGQTDGLTDMTEFITFLANAVGQYNVAAHRAP